MRKIQFIIIVPLFSPTKIKFIFTLSLCVCVCTMNFEKQKFYVWWENQIQIKIRHSGLLILCIFGCAFVGYVCVYVNWSDSTNFNKTFCPNYVFVCVYVSDYYTKPTFASHFKRSNQLYQFVDGKTYFDFKRDISIMDISTVLTRKKK